MPLSEEQVEQAACAWFEAQEYKVMRGADISPGGPTPLRATYDVAVLEEALKTAIVRINTHLPYSAAAESARVH
jgi:type I restriction enzyme R subunit